MLPRLTPHTNAMTVPRSTVAAAVAGNAIEFYDFVTYAYFAVYIGKSFFPSTSPYLSLLASVGVFGVGFAARPLGALVMGGYADRKGRRPALVLTLMLMTLGTAGLALTPSYADVGIAAPLVLVLARLVQGFALGGDVGPATAFLLEAAPPAQRGLFTSWQLASQGASAFVAGVFGLALTATLTPDQMQAWGWRIPFVVALLLIPLLGYLRKNMPETLTTTTVDGAGWTPQWQVVLWGLLVVAGSTIATYVSTYMTTFAGAALKLPATTAMAATVVVGLALMAGALIGGWWCDRAGPAWPALAPRIGLTLLAPLAFQSLVRHPSLGLLLGVSALLAVLTAMSGAGALFLLTDRLASQRRAAGVGIAYALATAVFGGTTQLVITWLVQSTGEALAPAWYVSATSLATCGALLLLLRQGLPTNVHAR